MSNMEGENSILIGLDKEDGRGGSIGNDEEEFFRHPMSAKLCMLFYSVSLLSLYLFIPRTWKLM